MAFSHTKESIELIVTAKSCIQSYHVTGGSDLASDDLVKAKKLTVQAKNVTVLEESKKMRMLLKMTG